MQLIANSNIITEYASLFELFHKKIFIGVDSQHDLWDLFRRKFALDWETWNSKDHTIDVISIKNNKRESNVPMVSVISFQEVFVSDLPKSILNKTKNESVFLLQWSSGLDRDDLLKTIDRRFHKRKIYQTFLPILKIVHDSNSFYVPTFDDIPLFISGSLRKWIPFFTYKSFTSKGKVGMKGVFFLIEFDIGQDLLSKVDPFTICTTPK
jgi:hypothetical protein